jgi:hypothetical protein
MNNKKFNDSSVTPKGRIKRRRKNTSAVTQSETLAFVKKWDGSTCIPCITLTFGDKLGTTFRGKKWGGQLKT